MKHYYYAENNQQFGPFTLKELKEKRLQKTILIWSDGMDNWAIADSIEELRGFLVSVPPPIPIKKENRSGQENNRQQNSLKYDLTYKKETDLIGWGIFLLILNGIAYLIQINSEGFYIAFSVFSLIVRILVAFWVVKVARRQNRNTSSWGLFAFFFPVPSLIIIGSLKKIKMKFIINEELPINNQIKEIKYKVQDLKYYGKYSEIIDLLNKVIEIYKNEQVFHKLRAYAYYKLMKFELAEKDFLLICEDKEFASFANYYLGNIKIKRYNREQAVEYWLIASKNGHEGAKRKLQTYYKYYGIFVLNKHDVLYKLRHLSKFDLSTFFLNSFKVKYLGGFKEIDDKENVLKLKSYLVDYYLEGFLIIIKSKTKTYNIGIIYFELEDIIYLKEDNKYRYKLINDSYFDLNENLVGMNYQKETGRTLSIFK